MAETILIPTNSHQSNVDTKADNEKEQWSWIIYDLAQSSVEQIAVYSIYPILLNYLAIQGGSSYSNPENLSKLPDFSTFNEGWYVPGSCVSGTNCVVFWLYTYIRPSTYVLNILSMSGIFNMLLLGSLNSVADNSHYKKIVNTPYKTT